MPLYRARNPAKGGTFSKLTVDQIITTHAVEVIVGTLTADQADHGLTLTGGNTITVPKAGPYRIGGQIAFVGGIVAGDLLQGIIRVNGTLVSLAQAASPSTANWFFPVQYKIIQLNAGDAITMCANKTSGSDGTTSVASGTGITWLSVETARP